MPVTPFIYHTTEEMHGNYQYVSLTDIINDMVLMSQDDDSYLKNTKRYQFQMFAREAIKLVTRQAANDILAFSFDVPDSLSFVLPQDYVEYVRISVVTKTTEAGKVLMPLNINRNMNVARGYLQDHTGKILFDQNGNILKSDGDNVYGEPYKGYIMDCSCGCGGNGGKIDTAKLSQYGEFTIDERRGKIAFSSNLMYKEIVVEYVSDGLQADVTDDEITVHKYCEATIKDWIYYSCIATRRTVPANEKQRALQRHKTTMHQSKLARADFNLLEFKKILRSKPSV